MSANPPLMPPYIRSRKFQPAYFQQMSFLSGGFMQSLDRSSPVWTAEYTTPPLTDARYDEMASFLDSLEQSSGTFLGYDPLRPMPRAYQTQALASDPWTQTGQTAPRVTASSYANATLTLDRLQNDAILTRGDYIALYYNPGWLLFRIQIGAVAAANAAVVTVKPRPVASLLTGVPLEINYRRAAAEFKLVSRWEEESTVDGLPIISLKAMQFIDRTLP